MYKNNYSINIIIFTKYILYFEQDAHPAKGPAILPNILFLSVAETISRLLSIDKSRTGNTDLQFGGKTGMQFGVFLGTNIFVTTLLIL